MIKKLKCSIREFFTEIIKEKFEIEVNPENLVVEYPPDRDMGDLAFTFCFDLAGELKKAPGKIAEDLVSISEPPEGCERLSAAGSGYINVFLDREYILRSMVEKDFFETFRETSTKKYIVEHTNINPNKSAHIGHLRNAVLGDTFVRVLKFLDEEVETQNFIDNTGVQVADVVVGFRELKGMDLEDIKAIDEKLDDFCWDLYAEINEEYEKNPELQLSRSKVLKAIENGTEPIAGMANYITDRIARAHLETMERINVKYDLLPREGDIIELKFWETAFEELKNSDAVYHSDKVTSKDCWVMNLEESPEFKDMEEPDKVLVRSNGTATYTAKDIAYQMWKFGILKRDFHYSRFFSYGDGNTVWRSSSRETKEDNPAFGRGDRVYNVIDVRQSYLQKVVAESLRLLGYEREAENSVHFSYEMVALSPKSCRELEIEIEEENADTIEMSGRKGIGVKADDLIDKLIDKAGKEIEKRNPDMNSEDKKRASRKIAVAALRYFMLKYTKNKIITFDTDEAVNFEGETGPYLQYSCVRVKNIFRKLERERGISVNNIRSFLTETTFGELEENPRQWKLIYRILRFHDRVEKAADSLELSGVAKYAFNLAGDFNSFYHTNPIVQEEDKGKRNVKILIAHSFLKAMEKLLELMGMEIPDRM